MHNYYQHVLLFIKRFFWLLILYTVSRLFFYLLNISYFDGIGTKNLIIAFIAGIRFDIAAIIFTNAVFLLFILPGGYKNTRLIRVIGNVLFIAINAIALLSNFIDARFFDFINKRSTSSVFTLMGTNKDVWLMIPQFLKDYWYVPVSWIIMVFVLWCFAPVLKQNLVKEKMTFKSFFLQSVLFIAITGLMLFGARGTGLKPISMVDTGKYTELKNVPLVLNTPFSILKTIENENIPDVHFLSNDTALKYYNTIHNPQLQSNPKPLNVVILIMESFSKEYSHFLSGGESYTPNLDSILKQSLVFVNAYANGTQSYEALPAIIAGVPSLMDRPYSGSNYADNYIESLPLILRNEGYSTSFFHGGNNGTMGFDNFARIAGIENYMGRTEYNNDKDYDGSWGIWDEPYLQYFARQMSAMKEPFFSSVFTLSSHHPYNVPAKYAGKFAEGPLPILKAIRYSDYSLGKFFNSAQSMPWFKNTLFIITSDHAAQSNEKKYNSTTGMFSIPLAFYCPADTSLHGIRETICQQIDIMPTILDYLGYDKPYFAFGTDIFDPQQPHRAISYVNGIYQLIEDDYVIDFDGTRVTDFFSLNNNEKLTTPAAQQQRNEMETTIKAIIQTYNYCLINNKMSVRKEKIIVKNE